MFAILYRSQGGVTLEDLRRTLLTFPQASKTHFGINKTHTLGVVWDTGCLLNKEGTEEIQSHESFALAYGRLDAKDHWSHHFPKSNFFNDSQRIAACVLALGEEAPHHLTGEFGLVHWTGRDLFLAVDHLGQRGLYYAQTSKGFVVSSHLPSLLSLPDTPRDVDGLGLALVAMMQMGRGIGYTAFNNIRRLTGGHYLWLRDEKKLEERRWWHPDFSIRRVYKDPRDYTAELEGLFDSAVRSCLPIDGPVACTLSGGLDSTLVAGFAAPALAETDRVLHAWTSIPHPALQIDQRPGWENNEWAYAHQMTEIHPNIHHHAVSPEGICLLDVFNAVHASSATPLFTAANHLWLTSIAYQASHLGCTVVLTGAHGNTSISSQGNGAIPRLIRRGKLSPLMDHFRHTPNFNKRALLSHFFAAVAGENTLHSIRKLRGKVPREFTVPGAPLMQSHVRDYYRRAPGELSPVIQRRDWVNMMMRPKTSFRADLMAHAGVEMRDPTADRRLCEYLLSCPPEAFIGEGFDRFQARLLGQGRVPGSIRWRRTRGEQSPEQIRFFTLYPERYRDTWSMVRQLPWTCEFVDRPVVDQVLEDLILGQPHPRLLAAAVHRILDVGLFLTDMDQHWTLAQHHNYRQLAL